jgi:hypothetical protein
LILRRNPVVMEKEAARRRDKLEQLARRVARRGCNPPSAPVNLLSG